MKHNVLVSFAAVAALTLGALPAHRAAADTGGDQESTAIVAPLDATDCSATPPTISLLGLTIDVSSADFGGASCTDLVVGQIVEVTLASSSPPLSATEVHQEGGSTGDSSASQDAGSGNESESTDNSGNGGGQDS